MTISQSDLNRLAELFETLKQRMGVVGNTEVGSVEHLRAWREVTVVTREIETIIPPATEPLK
jgi:hypothetical protein